ncbi:MAG: LolA family protein [Thermoanaerobaculia bacterium]
MTQFFLSGLLALTSGLPPEAESALARAAALYGDGTAHRATFTQIYTPSGFTAVRRESGTVWIQAPERLRFDYGTPEKKIFTYDAGKGRLYTPDDNQLAVAQVSPEDRARLPIVFLSDPSQLARLYQIAPEPGEPGVVRLQLRPRSAGSELAWLRISIAKDGTMAELAYEDSSGNRTEFRFEGWRKRKARPAADYRVTGPPGTRELEN